MVLSYRVTAASTFLCTALLLTGCSSFGGDGTTTASLQDPPAQAQPAPATARVDPACTQLGQSIGALRAEGVPAKVDVAAQKKTALKAADMAKVSQYLKATDEFNARKCPPALITAAAPATPPVTPVTKSAPATKAAPAAAVKPVSASPAPTKAAEAKPQ